MKQQKKRHIHLRFFYDKSSKVKQNVRFNTGSIEL